MAHKTKPFTRKQREKIRKQLRRALAEERRAERDERKAYEQTLDVFKRCDPERTERLADGE